MRIRNFIRLVKRDVLELTKRDLIKLSKKYPSLTNEPDFESRVLNYEPDDIVGYLDAYKVSTLEKIKDGIDVYENDFWFVSRKCIDIKYPQEKLTFGVAYELAKLGHIIYRYGWNGNKRIDDKDFKLRMFVVYVPSSEIDVRENTPYWNAGIRGSIKIDSHLDLYTPAGTIQPGWVASQADITANDWVAVDRTTIENNN